MATSFQNMRRDLSCHVFARVPAFPLAAAAMAPLRARAEAAGSSDFSPIWSGQNARGCREIGAARLVAELAARIGKAA